MMSKCMMVIAGLVSAAGDPVVPILDDAEAWRRLPPLESGHGARLPIWARALAASHPQTTAAMLELDDLHRTHSPLADGLRARMRWVAAHANHSPCTEASAAADLRRAGVAERDIADLGRDLKSAPAAEQPALRFARQLTLDAAKVTDAEVAELMQTHGAKNVVAMVQLLAHANFQDRLVLALGLPPEPDPPPPLGVRFRRDAVTAPPRLGPVRPVEAAPRAGADWQPLNYAELQRNLEQQRQRPGRIRVPGWDEIADSLPAEAKKRGPLRIQWSLVCMGYQPQLAAGWSACTRSFAQESGQERVLQESIFWVVTRTLQCYY